MFVKVETSPSLKDPVFCWIDGAISRLEIDCSEFIKPMLILSLEFFLIFDAIKYNIQNHKINFCLTEDWNYLLRLRLINTVCHYLHKKFDASNLSSKYCFEIFSKE